MASHLYTLRDKVCGNEAVMRQVYNNAPEQVFLGDYTGAVDESVIGCGEEHHD